MTKAKTLLVEENSIILLRIATSLEHLQKSLEQINKRDKKRFDIEKKKAE